MLDGLYRIRYSTPNGECSAVCTLHDGRITGGGQVLYCTGTYHESGRHLSGRLHARKHARATLPSPVLGLDEFHVRLEGTISGDYAQITGKIEELPGAPPLRGSILRLSGM